MARGRARQRQGHSDGGDRRSPPELPPGAWRSRAARPRPSPGRRRRRQWFQFRLHQKEGSGVGGPRCESDRSGRVCGSGRKPRQAWGVQARSGSLHSSAADRPRPGNRGAPHPRRRRHGLRRSRGAFPSGSTANPGRGRKAPRAWGEPESRWKRRTPPLQMWGSDRGALHGPVWVQLLPGAGSPPHRR